MNIIPRVFKESMLGINDALIDKVEYSLTDFGRTSIPLIQAIANWGDFVAENYTR